MKPKNKLQWVIFRYLNVITALRGKSRLNLELPFKQRLLIFIGGIIGDKLKPGQFTLVGDDENLHSGENGFVLGEKVFMILNDEWVILDY